MKGLFCLFTVLLCEKLKSQKKNGFCRAIFSRIEEVYWSIYKLMKYILVLVKIPLRLNCNNNIYLLAVANNFWQWRRSSIKRGLRSRILLPRWLQSFSKKTLIIWLRFKVITILYIQYNFEWGKWGIISSVIINLSIKFSFNYIFNNLVLVFCRNTQFSFSNCTYLRWMFSFKGNEKIIYWNYYPITRVFKTRWFSEIIKGIVLSNNYFLRSCISYICIVLLLSSFLQYLRRPNNRK